MHNFLHKHFELVSMAVILGAVGALCMYENHKRERPVAHVICADGDIGGQRPLCVTVTRGNNMNNTAYVPMPKRR